MSSRFASARAGFMLAVVSFSLAACSTLNEGQIDYRRADPTSGMLLSKYRAPTEKELILKEDGSDESISVHLLQAFIKDFSEATDRWLNKITLGRVTIRGEIAIIAKVFEVGSGNTPDFTLAETKGGGGRLIYYSGDVRPGGHFLNFSALPIYGPIAYKGRPLVIQLTVIEMDNAESAKIKGLLKTLAGIGASAYPPASPVLAVLDRVGEQLLKGDTDDTEFRYTFVLYPGLGIDKTLHPVLAAGNYALVKDQTGCGNFCDTDWSSFKLDIVQGRLVEAGTQKLFKDKSYLVVQINKGFSSLELDTAQTFSEFEKRLMAEAAAGMVDPDAIVGGLKISLARSVTYSRVKDLLTRAAALRATAANVARELARDALERMQADLKKEAKDRALSEDQTAALVRRLRLFPEAKPEIKDLTADQIKTTAVKDLVALLNL